jgi:hypothetical protein
MRPPNKRFRKSTLTGILFCVLIASGLNLATAADLEMVDGYGNITGVIDASEQGLWVHEYSGDRFFYRRAPQYDLPGGRYLGFYNYTLNRIIRFPRSGRGLVERADLDTPYPRFVPATVSVRPLGSGPGFAPYLDTWLPGWHGSGFYGPTYGLPYGRGGLRGPLIGGYYSSGITLNVGPSIGFGAPSSPLLSAFPTSQPQSTLIESRIVEAAPLAPVEVEFVNSHNETLIVTLTDTHHPDRQPRYKIAPGGSQRVKLPRDAARSRVDTYQTIDATGQPVEHESRIALPPEPRYEVIVHRMRIQSIAIDRTGKSPNEIEDINVQGVSVGHFTLPPGDQLTSGEIDVFAAAR